MKEQKFVIGIVVALLAAAGIFFFMSQVKNPADVVVSGERALFGQHLKDQGVIFYGAFWCSHCQEQKKRMGKEVWEQIYVECSTPDGRGQLDVCKEAGVDSYPTIVFKDGTKKVGVIDIAELEERTGYSKTGTTSPQVAVPQE
jgi:thiol-disulfide isomerase/thioredoxin